MRSYSRIRVVVQFGFAGVYLRSRGLPEWERVDVPAEGKSGNAGEIGYWRSVMGPLHGLGILWTVLGVFGAGLALNLTPCVYPLIPITVSYFGLQTGQGRLRVAFHALLYLLGLALMNSILGVAAALTGNLLGSALQNPLVLLLVAGVLLFLAASLFGFWEIKLPQAVVAAASRPRAGYVGSLFMGLTLGVVAAPCLGPFVLGLLTWVASRGSPWLGFLVFFTLSLGLGLPLAILGMLSANLDRLPRSGEWMVWVKRLLGWVLVGAAAFYLSPLFPRPVGVFLMAAIALSAGVHLGWLDRTRGEFKAFQWIRTVVGILGVLAAAYLVGWWITLSPAVNWQPFTDQALAEARWSNKPVILQFTADWCAPCHKLDELTFRDPEVVEEAQKYFVTVKVDLTLGVEGRNKELIQNYGVKGVPTIVFLDSDGREFRDLRIIGWMTPARFLVRMARARRLNPATSRKTGTSGSKDSGAR
jgi:thiol:disulfide interchange protein DsbD